MQDAVVGGPGLTQRRHLVTPVPGPRSLELHARKNAAVSDGIGVTLPVYVAAAGGGVIVDVDGNSLIDMASGIAVTGVGNAAPEVVTAVNHACHEQGVLTLACGTFGNVIPLLPPLVIGEELLDDALDVLEGAVSAVSGA
jgi:4-aminobutyrate aminotransferase-like enzyme